MNYDQLKELNEGAYILIQTNGQKLKFPIDLISREFWEYLSTQADIVISNANLTSI